MNDLRIFNSPIFGEIRTAGTSEEPLFCLSDVCKAIGIANARNVKERLDEEDVHLVDTLTQGGMQKITYVTESGLYDTIIRSDSENAKPFRKWVTSEVLPSIRKTGMYATPQKQQEMDILVTWVKGLQELLHLNNAATLALLKKGGEPLGLPIPDYVEADNVSHSVSELLKRNGIKLSAQAFNKLLETNGMIRRETRKSRNKNKEHHYWVVTDKGGYYGINFTSPENPQSVQPYWYDEKFSELCRSVGVIVEA